MSANRECFDPVRRALDFALLDDESETDEEKQAVEEGKADIRADRILTTKELKRELGFHFEENIIY